MFTFSFIDKFSNVVRRLIVIEFNLSMTETRKANIGRKRKQ